MFRFCLWKKYVFYWSKKKRSCGVFSIDLCSSEESPLCGVIVPLCLHTHEYCNVSSIFGGYLWRTSHMLYFFSFVGTFQGHIIKRFNPVCAHAVLLQLHVYPITTVWCPLLAGPLCWLSELSYELQKLELVWVGDGLKFGFLLLLKEAELWSGGKAVGMAWKWGSSLLPSNAVHPVVVMSSRSSATDDAVSTTMET